MDRRQFEKDMALFGMAYGDEEEEGSTETTECEMIDRMAEAYISTPGVEREELPEEFVNQVKQGMRSVLQAMWDPTDAMVRAGEDNQAYVDSTVTTMWRSMIDEASGERHREVANTDHQVE